MPKGQLTSLLQVITNVCGTLALLAVLFNADINQKGPILENFLEFTKDFSAVVSSYALILCVDDKLRFPCIESWCLLG
jgi:hypothetical protein